MGTFETSVPKCPISLRNRFNGWVAECYTKGDHDLPEELLALEHCRDFAPGSIAGTLRLTDRPVTYRDCVRVILKRASARTPAADDAADANEAATVSTAASVVIGSAAEST